MSNDTAICSVQDRPVITVTSPYKRHRLSAVVGLFQQEDQMVSSNPSYALLPPLPSLPFPLPFLNRSRARCWRLYSGLLSSYTDQVEWWVCHVRLRTTGDVEENPGIEVLDPCSVCEKGVAGEWILFRCSVCEQWCHKRCSGIRSEPEFRQLSPWSCLSCNDTVADAAQSPQGQDNASNSATAVDLGEATSCNSTATASVTATQNCRTSCTKNMCKSPVCKRLNWSLAPPSRSSGDSQVRRDRTTRGGGVMWSHVSLRKHMHVFGVGHI